MDDQVCTQSGEPAKNSIISEKTVTSRLITTSIVIAFCLLAISFSAFAYFTSEVSSVSNVIESAAYRLDVTVTRSGETTPKTENAEGKYVLSEGIYNVTLVRQDIDGQALTGFGIVETVLPNGNNVTFHTVQLGKDGDIQRSNLTFVLDLTGVTESVEFEISSHWGTSFYYGYDVSDTNPLYIDGSEPILLSSLFNTLAVGESEQGGQQSVDEGSSLSGIKHTVAEGEYLALIAEKYHTTVDRVAIYNGITDWNLIYPGQVIVIPPDDWVIP